MRSYSMKSHNRRNHQHWLNTFVRNANRAIENDDLWLGRFYARQKGTRMEWFEDKSGGILHCILEFVDKKTGRTEVWYTDCLAVDWNYWWKMNDFIVNECDVWNENPGPYETKVDYRGSYSKINY